MRICYLSHVDWNWIKQRPQFLAEGLSRHHEVDYYFFPARNGATAPRGTSGSVRTAPLWKLPLSGRVPVLAGLQRTLNAARIRAREYDAAWVCSPEVLLRVGLAELPAPLVYDCMDDMIEPASPRYRDVLLAHEEALLSSASVVFASSDRLRATMIRRGCAEDKLTIVRNATDLGSLLGGAAPPPRPRAPGRFTIVYFGTIARWIDLDLIHALLEDPELASVHVKLIGPSELPVRTHERLAHLGPVPHGELRAFAADADLFLLPFKLNETTLAVDPVKLYEYIAMHRNIAARRYPEIQRYAEFVRYYDDYRELKSIIQDLMADGTLRYDRERADRFCAANTWDARLAEIEPRLEQLVHAAEGARG